MWANRIATAFMLILCLIVIIITITLIVCIVRLLRSRPRRSCKKSVTAVASLSTNILYMISTIIFCVGSLHHIHQSDADIVTEWGGTAMHLMSQTTMIFTFVSRVDLTFRHSAMRYSTTLIRALYVLSAFTVSFCVLDVVFMVLEMWRVCYLTAAVWLLIFSVLSVLLVYLFIRKMLDVVITSKTNQEIPVKDRSASDISSCSVKDMIDEELLYVVTKHAVLVSFAITSSLVLELLAMTIAFSVTYNDWVPVATFWIALDSVLNVLCNYLLFAFASPVYSVLCSPLHRACTACQVWTIEKKIRKSNCDESEQPVKTGSTVLDLATVSTTRTSVSSACHDGNTVPITPTDA